MKYIALWVTVVLFFVEASCKASNGDTTGRSTGFINQCGQWRCYSNLWVIVNPDSGKISVKYLEADGSTEQTADGWRTGKGWFVFAESPEHIWIYNGDSLRLLLITPRIGTAIYCEKYPIAVPPKVSMALAKLK